MKGSESGTLFVVATPIGNLEDITLRALKVLREVAVVAAEDTRRSGNLLRHFEFHTPLVSLHEHNELRRSSQLIARLQAGESVALVTDAGTPGISDPGARFVSIAREAGIRVEPVPGASSVTAVLSAAGLEFEGFAFLGFPPIKSNDRKRWFDRLSTLQDLAVVCFEAPHRLRRTLKDLGLLLGNRPIFLARELTKLHEEWLHGAVGALESQLGDPRGEFVIVVPPKPTALQDPAELSDNEIAGLFGQLIENAMIGRREAIRTLARQTGQPQKHIYAAIERAKISGKNPK